MAITSAHDTAENTAPKNAGKDRSKLGRNLFNTIPIVLAGTMALALNVTAPIHPDAKRADKLKPSPSEPGKNLAAKTVRNAFAAASRASTNPNATPTSAAATEVSAVVPTTYTVAAGDSISSIAGRYGLATASVLALNGLGWKSVIYPGQTLTLSKSGAVTVVRTSAVTPTTRYTILTGDTVSRIAAKFGLSTQTLLSANGLGAASIIYPGQTIAIPSTSGTASVSAKPIAAKPIASTPVASTSVGSGTSYVIKSGDSIAAIATKFGVTTQAILTANGLNWSSIIYSGKTLTIPTLAIVTTSSVTPSAALTPEMKANALTIIRVGKSLGVPSYGLVIALAAAAQESGLRNLTYGDRDSLGLFQQRPSAGWGSRGQLLDPTYAAKLFYGGSKNPNVGNTRGLLDIPGWQSMSVTQAAQAVQLSGYPTAYAKWETAARTWVATIG